MEYLEPQPLFDVPEYYSNPTDSGQFGSLANQVKKEADDLILTSEFVESQSISGGTITFKKLRYKYTVTVIEFGTFITIGQSIEGVYIKGVITWNDRTQSQFSTINNITYNDGVITIEIDVNERTPVSAILRISQLAEII